MVEGVELYISLSVGVSLEQGPTTWSFHLALPTTCYSRFSFFATAQATGKGERETDTTGGFNIPVPVQVKRKQQTRPEGIWFGGGQNTREVLLLAGRGAVSPHF